MTASKVTTRMTGKSTSEVTPDDEGAGGDEKVVTIVLLSVVKHNK